MIDAPIREPISHLPIQTSILRLTRPKLFQRLTTCREKLPQASNLEKPGLNQEITAITNRLTVLDADRNCSTLAELEQRKRESVDQALTEIAYQPGGDPQIQAAIQEGLRIRLAVLAEREKELQPQASPSTPQAVPQEPLKLTRRAFLRNAAGAAAGLALFGKGVTDPAARSAVRQVGTAAQAALERITPSSTEDVFEQLSDETISTCYDRYFRGREHILSKEAWMRDGPGDRFGFGRAIGRLANIYYETEKHPGETFDSYYERFIEQLATAAQEANLDLIVFVTSLHVSAANIDTLEQYAVDVAPVGEFQTFWMSVADNIGQRYWVQNELMPPNGFLYRLHQAKQQTPFRDHMPREEWDIKAVTRLISEPTIGMMDFEPSMRARALLLFGSEKVKQVFRENYPDVVQSYQRILEQLGIPFETIIGPKTRPAETVATAKMRLEQLSLDYIAQFGQSLDIFPYSDEALAKIGIKVPPDDWQKFNRTDVWYQLMRRRALKTSLSQQEQRAIEAVKHSMQYDFQYDRFRYYQNLMSQQILNQRFTDFLIEQGEKAGRNGEVALLKRVKEAVDVYSEQAKLARTSYLDGLRAEVAQEHGHSREYDSRFQTLTSALTTKMLSEIAGSFNPNDKDSLYWNVYRILSIRETSHSRTMVRDSGFANDVLVDPPYAMKETVGYIDGFERLLLEKGILTRPAEQDVYAMDGALAAIWANDFSKYPHLTNEDKKIIYEYCRDHVIEGGEVAINRSHQVLALT